jgi:ArsR family transcriptional regulator
MEHAPLRIESIEATHRLLRELAQENRLSIIALLIEAEELSAGEIQERLGIEQALLSHHLKVLVKTGMLSSRTHGRFRYFSVDQTRLLQLITALHFLQLR